MDRATLQATLDMAEKHVMDGDSNIARQRELIAEMLSYGLDVSRHQATLANFEETQRLHVEYVRRLKQELVSAGEAKADPLNAYTV